MDRSNEHIKRFDEILNQVIKICDKQSSRVAKAEQEELWKDALSQIFSIKRKVFEFIASNDFAADSDSDSQEGTEEKENFRRFIISRHQHFIKRMSEYVNLHHIVGVLEKQGHFMEYMEFRQTFKDKVKQESYTEEILQTARKLLTRDSQDESATLGELTAKGIAVTHNRCDYCKVRFNTKWDK